MNIKVLKHYMFYCMDKEIRPTFEGLKKYNKIWKGSIIYNTRY